MKIMTPLEKAMALNPDFAENYMNNLINGVSREDFFSKIMEPLHPLIPDIAPDLVGNASLIFQRTGARQNKMGFIFHDFSNGDSLAVNSNRDIVFVKKGDENTGAEKEVITTFAYRTINGISQRVYRRNGEEVIIGSPEKIIDILSQNSIYRPDFTDRALDEFGKQDIYIEGSSIYVPPELEYAAHIVILLSVNNPASIKGKLENCIIYKDTGVTLKDLKENSEAINSMSFRYGTKIHGSKLHIVETDELFNIYFTKRKNSSKKLGKFSIYSV